MPSSMRFSTLTDFHPGEAPEGNKIEKCRLWLRHGNKQLPDALANFANLIDEMMDAELAPPYRPAWNTSEVQEVPEPRERLIAALAEEGLSYARGGYIHGASLTGASKSLGDRLKTNSIQAVETEFDRAYKSIEADPPAAVTAACAILRADCKHYREMEELELPNKQLIGNLWPLVMQHLGLSPKDIADDDLEQILTGLYSISTGIAALRIHEGSAQGRGKKTYRIQAKPWCVVKLEVHRIE